MFGVEEHPILDFGKGGALMPVALRPGQDMSGLTPPRRKGIGD